MMRFIAANRTRILVSLLIVFVIGIFVARSTKQANNGATETTEKKPVEVSVQKVSDLKASSANLKFSGVVAGDQEIKIAAQTNGTVRTLNFDLGKSVTSGQVLLTIDDTGNFLSSGKNDFQSVQVQQTELQVRQMKKQYDLAKRKYDRESTKDNKTARDVAKLQYESAQIALKSALDARTIIAPFSGTVTSRGVSVGDAVSSGQLLATISKTTFQKVRFYLSPDDIKYLHVGTSVMVDQRSEQIKAVVTNIAPEADDITRKFLIEAVPERGNVLSLGTVVDVWVKTADTASGDKMYVPLSALNTTQQENFVFVAGNGTANKVPVSIVSVSGETALISASLSDDTQIVVDGNKLITDGDSIEVKQ